MYDDTAFDSDEFKEHLVRHGTEFRPIPSRRHSKNVLESKHGVIRNVFLGILQENDDNAQLSALQAVSISKDLYGSHILSSFELVKGFNKPVVNNKQNTGKK